MPYVFDSGITSFTSSFGKTVTGSGLPGTDISPSEEEEKYISIGTLVESASDFRRLTMDYLSSEAQKYGYPSIFAAMSLVNSSIQSISTEGQDWIDLFDAGMTYADTVIKTGGFTGFEKTINTVKNDPTSPKVTFTPSSTFT